MSLTDKVIKNTYYLLISQLAGFIFPLILTPFIIGHIGETAFGIYALVLGFAGIFGLFDMSISSSFIKFISEHYNKKEYNELNAVINTGIVFYTGFSVICCVIGIVFMDKFLGMLNISPDFAETARLAYIISLIAFFVTNSFGIFNSILVSLQKMYLTSILGMALTFVNFILVMGLLLYGYGLNSLLYLHIVVICISILISFFAAKKALPQLKLNPLKFHLPSLKKMSNFGLQMQVSKLASFAGEKYDEYLLAFFSVLSNVTFYNISSKVVRIGKFLPYQLVPQVAPVAAELKARNEDEKLNRLFTDTSKYLTLTALPIFTYIFVFADLLIKTWMGDGFEISAHILRILVIGQMINMIFSAPGNSIIPNLGFPKYQMYEGLIFLLINLILSYLLIKFYGIVGAAFGNTISTSIASLFVFFTAASFFKRRWIDVVRSVYIKPFLISLAGAVLTFLLYKAGTTAILKPELRIEGILYIIITVIIFTAFYLAFIFNISYLNNNDKTVMVKIISRALPLKKLINYRNKKSLYKDTNYNGEFISIFIITHNRLGFLKKCISSLLPTLKDVNYELIIWNNASDDGTKEYLSEISSLNNIQIVNSETNDGTNAKGKAAELCKGDFIVGIDDDVLDFPDNWLINMIEAYKSAPRLGYLSSDVIQNEHTTGAKPGEEHYFNISYNNGKHVIQYGPAGGWCFLLSRKVYQETGNFSDIKGRIFFSEDGDYLNRLKCKGYKFGILKDVKVFHATGDYYNKEYMHIFEKKMKDYNTNKAEQYHTRLKYRKIFDIKGMYNKFLLYAERELAKDPED